MTAPMRASIRAAAARLVCAVALALWSAAHAAGTIALDVELDPHTRRFSASVELLSPGVLSFPLHESLSVRSASVDGRPVTFSETRRAASSRTWHIAAARGARVRIDYGGTLPLLDRRLGHRRVLEGVPPGASAEGSFLPARSGWYPAPASLFSYTVRLSLPADQRGLVAGRLASETLPSQSGERYTAAFELVQPTDGIDLMAGPYVVREKLVTRTGAEPLRLRTYFYREIEALADGYLEDSARYIALYSARIGEYPYSGFSVVASPLPTGFGMPTLTYIGTQVLKFPFIRETSLGHEVLHNWWGNGVYVDYRRGNWSEGLTTFMADYFYKEHSADAAREMRVSWLRDFAAVPDGAHLPLSAFRSRSHGAEAAVGYGKAAMVFLMLRDAIGSDAFDRGIRTFWERHQFRTASWDDLRAAFEGASGRSLAAFFDQWVSRAGGPRVSVRDAQAGVVAGRNTLTLTLSQGTPAYALDVPLEVLANGKREIRRIAIERQDQTLTLEMQSPAEGVRVDPDFRLWRVLDPRELPPILRQWIVARTPRVSVVSNNAEASAAATRLAKAFFESQPQPIAVEAIASAREPVLLVGLRSDVDDALARLGIARRPDALPVTGSAHVWTLAATAALPPLAVIAASDTDALEALARPLPHYGSQSWLAFDRAKVIARGVWPAESPVVRVTQGR